MRPSFVALVLACLLPGCADSVGSDEPRNLARGSESGIHENVRAVLTDVNAWRTLWNGHQSGEGPKDSLPSVDFEKERVLAVVERASSACATVTIERVRTDPVAETTVAEVRFEEGSGACPQVVSYAFHFVAIRAGPTDVTFEDV